MHNIGVISCQTEGPRAVSTKTLQIKEFRNVFHNIQHVLSFRHSLHIIYNLHHSRQDVSQSLSQNVEIWKSHKFLTWGPRLVHLLTTHPFLKRCSPTTTEKIHQTDYLPATRVPPQCDCHRATSCSEPRLLWQPHEQLASLAQRGKPGKKYVATEEDFPLLLGKIAG